MGDTEIPYDPAKIEEKIQSYWNKMIPFQLLKIRIKKSFSA